MPVLPSKFAKIRSKKGKLEQLEKDWNNGVDFRMDTGQYCSRRDVDLLQDTYKAGYLFINARINKRIW